MRWIDGSFVPEEASRLPSPSRWSFTRTSGGPCAARLFPASPEPSIGKELAGVLNDRGDSGMLDLALDGNSVKLAVHTAGDSNAE